MSSAPHLLPTAFLVLGWMLAFLGSLWIIVLGWQRSVAWGIGCFLLPLIQLIYVALHWKESKEAFFMILGGFVCMIIAHFVSVPSF